ncbi:MAG: MBL fold metallo-hydrolase [Treponema sp.]|nr:MBL fold metallo-hydrolase [Treponema sp.]
MRFILMGTGTSHGIPVIGCDCKVCTSADSRDNRMRCSAYVVQGKTELVIDVGPEFRLQALRNHIKRLDAVLLTHSHADHLHGLDDLRVFSHTKPCHYDSAVFPETAGEGLPVYTNAATLRDIHSRFNYLFCSHEEGGGVAKLNFKDCSSFGAGSPLVLGDLHLVPVPLRHGSIEATGWLLWNDGDDGKRHSIAYLTDCSAVPDESIALVREQCGVLEHLVIDGLRVRPHSTHFSFDESLACAEKIGAKHTWFIHMNHDLLHTEIQKYIDERLSQYPTLAKIVAEGGSVAPAYDQLELMA